MSSKLKLAFFSQYVFRVLKLFNGRLASPLVHRMPPVVRSQPWDCGHWTNQPLVLSWYELVDAPWLSLMSIGESHCLILPCSSPKDVRNWSKRSKSWLWPGDRFRHTRSEALTAWNRGLRPRCDHETVYFKRIPEQRLTTLLLIYFMSSFSATCDSIYFVKRLTG
jgi:hypothetical protein